MENDLHSDQGNAGNESANLVSDTKKIVSRDGNNVSLWQPLPGEQLSGDTDLQPDIIYDTLIVGAGITGLTAALLLQKAGQKCAIADAHNVGYGTTGGTTAHINTFSDTTYAEIESDFDLETARLVAKSISGSVSLIHDNVVNHGIDCDFEWKKGYVYAETDEQVKELDDVYESAVKVGVKVSETAFVPTKVPYLKAIVFDNQAQFHPLKYLAGLQKEFIALGGVVIENTLINEIETKEEFHLAKSQGVEIKAKNVFYATHIPPGGINVLHFRCAPYRSYVIAVTLKEDGYPDALVYDMQDPYHYLRTHVIDDRKYLIIGGSDHKTGHGDPQQSFADLVKYANQYYQVDEIAYKWSAQYFEPADGIPYIGKLPGASEGIYTATGYSGNGMIFGTISAMVVSDLILKGESEYADIYDPARIKPIAGFTEIVKENADVAYRFIADRFSMDEISSVGEISNDSGAVVEYRGQKLAVYKSPAGEIHALNPVCTHAKCIVEWNNSEKSWDCPCHGARYDTHGHVLTGPARRSLEQIDFKAKTEA